MSVPQALKDGDVIEVAGVSMTFYVIPPKTAKSEGLSPKASLGVEKRELRCHVRESIAKQSVGGRVKDRLGRAGEKLPFSSSCAHCLKYRVPFGSIP